MFSLFIIALLSFSLVSSVSVCSNCSEVQASLGSLLSLNASIVCTTSAAPRWNEYAEPSPGTVVNVATEKDVATTVSALTAFARSFLAQNGGNGWADTFHLNKCGILINLRGIRQISFDVGKATFQGGTIIQELVEAAYVNDVRLSTGTCNCVGVLGAILGGGLSRTMGLYGTGVDQLISMNVVTSSGALVQVDASSNLDLWWALRGAGANFGIVTSATVRSYPIPAANNVAWTGFVTYTPDKIEAIVGAINDLDLKAEMEIDFYFATTGPPSFTPSVLVVPFYVGNATAGRAAFASIFEVGPASDGTAEVPYNQWNAGSSTFCVKGQRKPAYGASMNRLDPTAWRTIWNNYLEFLKNPDTGSSIVLIECYSTYKALSIPSSSSAYPFRNVSCHATALPWYSSSSLDEAANVFGEKTRDLWRLTDGLASNISYINFAHGDESLSTIYGSSLPRLQALKKIYDPHGRFNQWFPLS